MNLERFIEALGPVEVVDAGPVEVSRSRLRHADRRAGHALLLRARGDAPTGTRSRPTAAPPARSALVVERPLDVDAAAARRRRRAAAMPAAAALFFGDPTRELDVAAITGTNGKTTTAFLLHAILDAGGPAARAAHEHRAARRRRGAPDRAQHAGGDRPAAPLPPDARRRRPACVMEATSIAQAQGRLDGTRFAVLVFTNLTQDHLDFHGTMEEYFEAKRRAVRRRPSARS